MLGTACLLLLASTEAVKFDLSVHNQKIAAYLAELRQYTFGNFVRDFGRAYGPDAREWQMRERIFNINLNKVIDAASKPGLTWTPGVTKFTDYSDVEYSHMLGYKDRRARDIEGNSGMRMTSNNFLLESQTPQTYNVLFNLTVASVVHDQGGCGSCWVDAALTSIEAALEKNQPLLGEFTAMGVHNIGLSREAIVACAPNPLHCGGIGGCDGATAEMAFKLIRENGVATADDVFLGDINQPTSADTGQTPQCNERMTSPAMPRISIQSYTVLPKNRPHLKQALIMTGAPIAVSVDATNWVLYKSGIYSDMDVGSKGEFTVNHVATLVGYHNRDPLQVEDRGYYLLKNSWGTNFGENGYIRLELKDQEGEHCGWDTNSHTGTACDGDENRVWVCGTCGILYDAAYAVHPYILKGGA